MAFADGIAGKRQVRVLGSGCIPITEISRTGNSAVSGGANKNNRSVVGEGLLWKIDQERDYARSISMRPTCFAHAASCIALATNRFNLKNLQNIQRPNHRSNDSARRSQANEDMQVMQELAANRRQRNFRLPPWANRALSEEQGRALPARDTMQSNAHGRSGSREMAADRGSS